MSQTDEEQDHIIVMTTSPGYWGKGKSITEAIKNSEWINGGDKVMVLTCGEEAYINEMGQVTFHPDVGFTNLGTGVVSKSRDGVMFDPPKPHH